ncbi:AAA family ATPase [Spirulina sp. CS-785/01]|uniref:AAA family ATPase n=1 Tax=Spirulina sp. CS-785/01 TaxID=3021716 RepID=UPI00232C4768|nr:AAA family ATPase [Spirulina sp. CS-785/01]MDB9312412.1 AAA family ATPase [Spirulina sp. CS-785/01]
MQITEISVEGLFGIFDHIIPLNIKERITIIHSPNGFGKTIMLKMLNGLFNSKYSIFYKIPFNNFKITLDNNSLINIIKKTETNESNAKISIELYKSDSKIHYWHLKSRKDTNIKRLPISILDDIVPEIERVDARQWRHISTGEILSLEAVMDRFEDFLPSDFLKSPEEPEWLENIKSDTYVRIIESQRLLNLFSSRSSRIYPSRLRTLPLTTLPTVSAYSEELAQLMQDKFTEYGTISQSLDRSFPLRAIEQNPPDVNSEQLYYQLNELDKTRSRLIDVGLLNQEETSEFQSPKNMDDSAKTILSVYIEDVEKKLSIFKDIAQKIELLRDIINRKFSYKKINFDKEKGFIFTRNENEQNSPNGKSLSPTDLSSGEQHELVLLYELLFKVKPNSLVLIDEPELSLHVGWQVQFLKDLQEITKLADIDILIATHSPDIIQDRWDLTVELKGVEA